MNQKELVRELKEMNDQLLAELREIKLALSGGAINLTVNQTGHSTGSSSRANIASPLQNDYIKIDEKTYVTKMETNLETGYDQITETQTEEDTKLKASKDKLKKLKGK